MKCARAKNLLDDVDKSIKDIRSFKGASTLEKSYLAKFLVVYTCGVYEEAIESILNERISTLRSNKMDKFFPKYINEKFRNPDIGKVAWLLGLFEDAWVAKINALPLATKTAFNNFQLNKNKVAHGKPCTVTLNDVIDDYRRSKRVITKIDQIVKFA